MPEPPKTQEELDFRVVEVLNGPWDTSKDGIRNMGNIEKKVGSSEVPASMLRLKKQGRIS